MNPTDRDSRERFATRVGNYIRYRPSYPPAVLSLLKARIKDKADAVVADLGSGTGIFTRLLLDAGFIVYAVEPNATMRKEAESGLIGHNRFHSVQGEAEATTLRDSSMDAITAAQAFHWFATKRAVDEFARILRPEGVVMVIWNDRKVDCDRFHKGYEDLLLRYGTDYSQINHRDITEEKIRELFNGWECEVERMENHQDFDFDGLRGRLESSSYCPTPEHPYYVPIMNGLELLFNRECTANQIRMEYECVVYLVRKIFNGDRQNQDIAVTG